MDFVQLAEGDNMLILDSTSAFVSRAGANMTSYCSENQNGLIIETLGLGLGFWGTKKRGVNGFVSL